MMVAAVLAAADTEPFYIFIRYRCIVMGILYVIIWNEGLAY